MDKTLARPGGAPITVIDEVSNDHFGIEVFREPGGPPVRADETLTPGETLLVPWLGQGSVLLRSTLYGTQSGRWYALSGQLYMPLSPAVEGDPRAGSLLCRGYVLPQSRKGLSRGDITFDGRVLELIDELYESDCTVVQIERILSRAPLPLDPGVSLRTRAEKLVETHKDFEKRLAITQGWLDKFQGIAAAESLRTLGFSGATADPYPKELLRLEVGRLLFGLWNVPVVSNALPAIPLTDAFWLQLGGALNEYDLHGTLLPPLGELGYAEARAELEDPVDALRLLEPNERPHFHWVCKFTLRIVAALEKAEAGP